MKNNQPDGLHKPGCPAPEDIAAFLCNELDLKERAEVENHLATCASCHLLADELGSSIRELKECPPEQDLHRDLTDEILNKIPRDEWRPEAAPVNVRWFSSVRMLRLAASFFLLLGAALVVRSWMQGQGRVTSSSISTANVAKSAALKDTHQWLASAQEFSGRWDAVSWGGRKEYTLALNGLALLTFVRNPLVAKENAQVIDRAAKYMMSCQRENGLFGEETEGMMYNHGIVTVALLEAYAINGDSSLKASLDKAMNFISRQQLATGGWSYANRPEATANTSVAVWQLQALLLSARLGWKDPEHSLKKGLRWLGSMIDDGGQFGYDRPRNSPEGTVTLTAMGALCMFMAPEADSPSSRGILMKLKNELVSSKLENANSDFYRCYFRAAAFNTAKTKECDRMLIELQHSLLAVQERSGENAGSWSPGDRWGSAGGRIYSTAVAALALEL